MNENLQLLIVQDGDAGTYELTVEPGGQLIKEKEVFILHGLQDNFDYNFTVVVTDSCNMTNEITFPYHRNTCKQVVV